MVNEGFGLRIAFQMLDMTDEEDIISGLHLLDLNHCDEAAMAVRLTAEVVGGFASMSLTAVSVSLLRSAIVSLRC